MPQAILLRGDRPAEAISRCITGISPALLSARLSRLQRANLVTKLARPQQPALYRLTTAGLELRPLIDQLGAWGQRWLPPPRNSELAPVLLLTDISSEIDTADLPRRPIAIEIVLADAPPPRHWWLVLSCGEAEVYIHDPGVPVVVEIAATLSALTNVWLGHMTWLHAVQSSTVQIRGRRDMVRSTISWLGVSRYAKVQRRRQPLPRT